MFKTVSGLVIAAIAGVAATAYVPAARADEAKTPYYPPHYGEFEDGDGYKYDTCKFDGYPGKYVKFDTKKIAEYPHGYYYPPVYYTVSRRTAKYRSATSQRRRSCTTTSPASTPTKNTTPDETTIDTYYSKFEIKKKANYGTLSCKFKTENAPAPVPAEPETLE